MSKENKCLKCQQPFKDGEKYLIISNDPKAGEYHQSCWAEIEQERNNPNSISCHECKKQIKSGEKYYSQVIPDSFDPQTVYYCEPCGEKKKNEGTPLPGSGKWLENNKCKGCGALAVGGYCQVCMITGKHGSRSNGNDDTERERERDKIGTLNPINAPNVVNELTL